MKDESHMFTALCLSFLCLERKKLFWVLLWYICILMSLWIVIPMWWHGHYIVSVCFLNLKKIVAKEYGPCSCLLYWSPFPYLRPYVLLFPQPFPPSLNVVIVHMYTPLVIFLNGRLVGWLSGLTAWLVGWLVHCLVVWFVDLCVRPTWSAGLHVGSNKKEIYLSFFFLFLFCCLFCWCLSVLTYYFHLEQSTGHSRVDATSDNSVIHCLWIILRIINVESLISLCFLPTLHLSLVLLDADN